MYSSIDLGVLFATTAENSRQKKLWWFQFECKHPSRDSSSNEGTLQSSLWYTPKLDILLWWNHQTSRLVGKSWTWKKGTRRIDTTKSNVKRSARYYCSDSHWLVDTHSKWGSGSQNFGRNSGRGRSGFGPFLWTRGCCPRNHQGTAQNLSRLLNVRHSFGRSEFYQKSAFAFTGCIKVGRRRRCVSKSTTQAILSLSAQEGQGIGCLCLPQSKNKYWNCCLRFFAPLLTLCLLS